MPALRRIEADLQANDGGPHGGEHKQVDLFSEIHLNELQRLEKAVEQAESDKQLLTVSLREAQSQAERSQAELQGLGTRIASLGTHVNSLQALRQRLVPNGNPVRPYLLSCL